MLKKRMRSEKGQVLVFSILLLPLVLGILALLVEMGNLYVHYWGLQNSADITVVAVTRNMTAIAIRREFATICRESDAVFRLVVAILRERVSESDFASMSTEQIKKIVITEIYSDNMMTPEEIKRKAIEINFDSITDNEKTLIAEIVAEIDFDGVSEVSEEKRNLVVAIATEINFDSMTEDEKDFIKGIVTEINFDHMQAGEKTLIEEIGTELDFKNMADSEKEFIAEIVTAIDFDSMAEYEKNRIAEIATEIDFDNITPENEKDDMTDSEKELIKKIAYMSNMDNINENFPIKPFLYSGDKKFFIKLTKDIPPFFINVFGKDENNSPITFPLPARAAASVVSEKLTPIKKTEIEEIEPQGSDNDKWIEVTP